MASGVVPDIATAPPPCPQKDSHAASSPEAAEWYAVYTTARHEKRVAQHFASRSIEHYLPLYSTQRRWSDGSKVTLSLPLFPCYIFVHIPATRRVRVLDVPGVLTIVDGTGGRPAALPAEEMMKLQAGLSERRAQPHPLLVAGQRGRIRTGALAGMEGIVVRVKNNYRVVLTVHLIMQSVAVEVSADDIELLDRVEQPVVNVRL
ncbi:MAG: UpxY family transcription antiterminator [Acidobacteriota bacterium]